MQYSYWIQMDSEIFGVRREGDDYLVLWRNLKMHPAIFKVRGLMFSYIMCVSPA